MMIKIEPHDISPWNRLSFISNYHKALVELKKPILLDGEELVEVICSLTAPETEIRSFKKSDGSIRTLSQIKSWPIVRYKDLKNYNESPNEEYKKSLIKNIDHENIISITLYDKNGNIILKQETN